MLSEIGGGVVASSGAPRLPRERTRRVSVGGVAVGGGAPVSVQSMCTTPTSDVDATLAQVGRLSDAGCELVRVTLPSAADVDPFRAICAQSPIPVIADVHFDYRLAVAAVRNGAAGVRINPGNIGSWDRVDAVIDTAGEAGVPIRIGVNMGSLDKDVDAREDLDGPQKLVASAESFVRHFEGRGFHDVVLSAKAHSVPVTLATYRELSRRLPEVALHVGVTEAGTLLQGTVKNCVGVGVLLEEGIGDTIRLSLTADPVEEVKVAWELLGALGMRRLHPELVSCPTCGRTKVNLIPIAEEVERRLQGVRAPISVAVMGCVVNGPGEAAGCDIGVACGQGQGLIFAEGKPLRKVAEADIVDELFKEIEARFS